MGRCWILNDEVGLRISHPDMDCVDWTLKDAYINPLFCIKRPVTQEPYLNMLLLQPNYYTRNNGVFLAVQPSLLDDQNYVQFNKWAKKSVGKAFIMTMCFFNADNYQVGYVNDDASIWICNNIRVHSFSYSDGSFFEHGLLTRCDIWPRSAERCMDD
jgi:hypothetical protein